jgi:hypothetical protein
MLLSQLRLKCVSCPAIPLYLKDDIDMQGTGVVQLKKEQDLDLIE